MNQILIPIICAGLAVSACNSNSSEKSSTTSDTTKTQTTTPIITPNTTTPTTTTVAAGMNPEHGKPGHRCDIPVGAPLNTPPPNPTVTSNTTAPTAPTINTSPTMVQPATTTAPGMNPAHGQPGHRCDIPVGSPLNSKPAANVTTVPVKAN